MDPATTPAPHELLTIEQAAGRINMSTRYVRRLVAERRLPTYRLGRAVRISGVDLDAYVAACCVEPITEKAVRNDLRRVA